MAKMGLHNMYTDGYPTALSSESYRHAITHAKQLKAANPALSQSECATMAVKKTFCTCINCGCNRPDCNRCSIFRSVVNDIIHGLKTDDSVHQAQHIELPFSDATCLAKATRDDIKSRVACKERHNN